MTTETETRHTELPWVFYGNRLGNFNIAKRGSSDVIAEVDCYERASEPNGKANAEFIVHAVNSHYELIEALKELMNEAEITLLKIEQRAAIVIAQARKEKL